MRIYLGADHAGLEMKDGIQQMLLDLGYEVIDMSPKTKNSDDDYTDIMKLAVQNIPLEPESVAILFGGSGQGEAMVANRFRGVRAAVFYGPRVPEEPVNVTGKISDNPFEIVKLSRVHNNANVLSIGARFVSHNDAKEAVKVWLTTNFLGEERHKRRVAKIDEL